MLSIVTIQRVPDFFPRNSEKLEEFYSISNVSSKNYFLYLYVLVLYEKFDFCFCFRIENVKINNKYFYIICTICSIRNTIDYIDGNFLYVLSSSVIIYHCIHKGLREFLGLFYKSNVFLGDVYLQFRRLLKLFFRVSFEK